MINKTIKFFVVFILVNTFILFIYKANSHANDKNIKDIKISHIDVSKNSTLSLKESNKDNFKNGVKWIKPVDGLIPNPFGNTYRFFNMYRAGHTGIDISAKIGTPVYSVDNGIIKFIKTKHNMRYGNYIVIEHKKDLFSLYAHLQKLNVKLNQTVKQGDIIGYTGVSGLASYPHLHFEVLDSIPIRDGAWGYNYICKVRPDNEIKKADYKRNIFNKDTYYDFLPLTTIKDKFAFENKSFEHIEHFYRMKNNVCIEEPIKPITYFNPEDFLPKYDKAEMPVFRGRFKSKNFVKPH